MFIIDVFSTLNVFSIFYALLQCAFYVCVWAFSERMAMAHLCVLKKKLFKKRKNGKRGRGDFVFLNINK